MVAVPVPNQGLTTQPVQFPPSAPQEPPPPYPGTQNTYPVQPQPIGGAQYSGYPLQEGSVAYPSAPYQLYAEAPPSAPAPYPTGVPGPTAVASAPPPQLTSTYLHHQGIELQQYPAATSAAQSVPPYPPSIPGQALYPNESVYTSAPGMAPYPTYTASVAGGDPNQDYSPRTNDHEY